MSLIIATGSNQGNSLQLLAEAKNKLQTKLQFIAESRIYQSKAVEYENQPDFFNQALEFTLPASMTADEVMSWLLQVEVEMGRRRDIPKGPRTIDLDIIFWGLNSYTSHDLIIPHPRWSERSFVVKPLQELPFFQTIKKYFIIPKSFTVDATPL
jgi:2-amino-4-hydroxy-6-hydroxymethyldihydropteridine diphosphokinase